MSAALAAFASGTGGELASTEPIFSAPHLPVLQCTSTSTILQPPYYSYHVTTPQYHNPA